jgi:hypothetical protein
MVLQLKKYFQARGPGKKWAVKIIPGQMCLLCGFGETNLKKELKMKWFCSVFVIVMGMAASDNPAMAGCYPAFNMASNSAYTITGVFIRVRATQNWGGNLLPPNTVLKGNGPVKSADIHFPSDPQTKDATCFEMTLFYSGQTGGQKWNTQDTYGNLGLCDVTNVAVDQYSDNLLRIWDTSPKAGFRGPIPSC